MYIKSESITDLLMLLAISVTAMLPADGPRIGATLTYKNYSIIATKTASSLSCITLCKAVNHAGRNSNLVKKCNRQR